MSWLITERSGADGEFTVARGFGSSTVVQKFILSPGAARLRVEVDVDWREHDKVLKLALPIDVHTTSAAFEIPFGHIRRDIHENTPWDAARFEVNAHRWIHVGEEGFGVAVANSNTYGWDVSRHQRDGGGTWTLVRATLLKGPRYPDPRADEGEHRFSFDIGPAVDVLAARWLGYQLNLPLRERAGEPVGALVSNSGGAVVEWVKLADDESGDVVVRAFEPAGRRCAGAITFGFPVKSVTEVDLLEEDALGDLPRALRDVSDGVAHLDLGPFQVVTLRVKPA